MDLHLEQFIREKYRMIVGERPSFTAVKKWLTSRSFSLLQNESMVCKDQILSVQDLMQKFGEGCPLVRT